MEGKMLKNGFLGYPTSFMLDFVVVSLVLIVPVLLCSVWLAKYRKRYASHRRLQIFLGTVLLVAVGAFEIDLQIVHGGWQNIVARQPLDPAALAIKVAAVRPWLWLHLVFAITTPVFWCLTIMLALSRFPKPPAPGTHSRVHRMLGWISTIDISLTSITGLLFYYMAFVA
jgi:putative membrane protein